ncbi:kinase-like domain-containing protein, partial [Podospora fimiseda]
QLVTQMVKAVKFLHENGLFHRDIKPSNIMYTRVAGQPHPNFYLGDFGLSITKECVSSGRLTP